MNLIKVVLLGAPGVGKTSIVNRFTTGQFTETYHPTDGKESHFVTMVVNDRAYHLRINDIPAIPSFPRDSLEEWTHFRHYGLLSADAYLLVFDVNSLDTFKYIRFIRDQLIMVRSAGPTQQFGVGEKSKGVQSIVAHQNYSQNNHSNDGTLSTSSPFSLFTTSGPNAHSNAFSSYSGTHNAPNRQLLQSNSHTVPNSALEDDKKRGKIEDNKSNPLYKKRQLFLRPIINSLKKKRAPKLVDNELVTTPTTTTNSGAESFSPINSNNPHENESSKRHELSTPNNKLSNTPRIINDTPKTPNLREADDINTNGVGKQRKNLHNLTISPILYPKAKSFREHSRKGRLMDTLTPPVTEFNRVGSKGSYKRSPKSMLDHKFACSKLLAASSILNLNAFMAEQPSAPPPTSPVIKNGPSFPFPYTGHGNKFAIVVVANKADKTTLPSDSYARAATTQTRSNMPVIGQPSRGGFVYQDGGGGLVKRGEKDWNAKQRKARKAAATAIRKNWKCPYIDHCSAKRDWSITAIFAETLRAVIKSGAAGAPVISTDPTEILLLNAPHLNFNSSSYYENAGGGVRGNLNGGKVGSGKIGQNTTTRLLNRKFNRLFQRSSSSASSTGIMPSAMIEGKRGKNIFSRWTRPSSES